MQRKIKFILNLRSEVEDVNYETFDEKIKEHLLEIKKELFDEISEIKKKTQPFLIWAFLNNLLLKSNISKSNTFNHNISESNFSMKLTSKSTISKSNKRS
jgi:hypothetical protein